ncbi:MAG: hypothetical protein M0011_14550 [Elusimicrobia bacterium]|nr:hypothetical protein [Elusimicrobiota bacterium]
MKYWAYVNNEILGPFEKEQLRELPAFSPSLLVCPQTPVGEKTADWKEVSTYPELSGGASAPAVEAPAPAPAPAPGLAAQPEPAKKAFAEPAIEPVNLSFKPLGGGKSVDPTPPPSHAAGLGNIEIAHFGRPASGQPASAPQPLPAREPVQEQAQGPAQQSSSAFDPISLSQIVRRTETISGQEAPASRNEDIALEPRASGLTTPAQETPAPAPEPVRMEQPVRTQFPPEAAPEVRPVPQPVMDVAGLERLIEKLDALSRSAATKNDVEAAVSPLRQKLEQMSLQPASAASAGDTQFQRQVMEKLYDLETSMGDIKKNLQAPPPAAARPAEMKPEKISETVFGVQPAREPEKKKKEPEPQKEPAKQEIKDEGTKKSNIGMAVKKVLKLVVTLVLLAAVLLGAVIGLKNFGVFDATKFIPFRLPFIGVPAPKPAEGAAPEAQAPEAAAPAREAAAQQPPAAAAQEAKAPAVPPEVVPEIIYIARTFVFKSSGETLENTLAATAEKAGGTYSVDNWVVSLGDGGKYSIVATVPAQAAGLVYAFTVDREKKLVEPANDLAKALFAEAAKKRAPRAAKTVRKSAAARKPAAKAAARPKRQPAKGAAKPAEDEYEYVYEDEE